MNAMDPDNESTFAVVVIHSDPREARIPKKAIGQALLQHHFCEEARFAVKLALEEALCNALKHGNCHDRSKTITIRYGIDDRKAVVVVRDEGGGFVPDDVPDPTTPERLPLPDGRGIMLMKAYMDEVCYRDNGREVCFVKLHR